MGQVQYNEMYVESGSSLLRTLKIYRSTGNITTMICIFELIKKKHSPFSHVNIQDFKGLLDHPYVCASVKMNRSPVSLR